MGGRRFLSFGTASDMSRGVTDAPTYMYAAVRVDGVRGGHERQLQQLHERAAGPRRGVQHVPPRHPPAGPLWLPALAPIYGYALESMATP